MKLYENEVKKIFDNMKIPIPKQYGVIHSMEELDHVSVNFPLMLKSMVLVGGRGKAGGIKKAQNIIEAKSLAKALFALRIKGLPVESILLEEAVDDLGACYIGTTMDPASFNNVVMVSASGGVDIEQVAREKPESIAKREIIDNAKILPKKIAQELAFILYNDLEKKIDSKKKNQLQNNLADIISKVYETYQRCDARLCEVNPLLLTSKGVIAADAKLVLDDNALFRQNDLLQMLGILKKRHDVAERTKNELRAQTAGFPYIDLLPENFKKDPQKLYVGLVPGGAGYGIFSIDEVATIGQRFFHDRVVPINFMDSGGGPTQNRVAEMFHLLMDNPLVDLIITSRFGGISSCDIFIRGLIKAVVERQEKGLRMIPIYGRMVGTDLPSARTFLEKEKHEHTDALKNIHIIIGNQRIMADVIREGIQKTFESKGWKL
jgi:succinyl-CoA synthetase beta subunit